VRLLLAPALGVLAIFAVALGALFQYSVVAFIPGSLQTGELTLANFRSVISPQYLGYVWDTVVLSLATTALTLVASYPVAYALARAPSRAVRSWLLVLTLAPFFTGAIVRTYAWILVLGNTPGVCLWAAIPGGAQNYNQPDDESRHNPPRGGSERTRPASEPSHSGWHLRMPAR